MFPWAALLLLCSLPAVHTVSGADPYVTVPRKTISLDEDGRLFNEKGIWNYSRMLLREDLGLLIVGGRGAIYALDMHNVSHKKSMVEWQVTEDDHMICKYKGKTEAECQNYIHILHEAKDGLMYACGTNAYKPACDYLSWNGAQLQVLGLREDGKGKCPFNPYERHASLMADGALYTATSTNFLSTEYALTRYSPLPLSNDAFNMWFYDPEFISMMEVPESEGSQTGDDDKVYMFFNENAAEFDFSKMVVVPRIARVCKGDMGGLRTLQKKWTSFLKARLNCPVPDPVLPLTLQDVFLWRDSDWRTSIFYGVFTGSTNLSAVCAYSVDAVSQLFSTGRFKTFIHVADGSTKWFTYIGEIPEPRPGACIDDKARAMGINQSLDIPDRTLTFVRKQMIMDTEIQPLQMGPQLLFRGTLFTRIVVQGITALDGERYNVMFIGTERGSILKAVYYDDKAVIINEIQLFHQSVPISGLRLSATMGLLYASSSHGIMHVPLSECGWYKSCLDCVLARDPYCAWDPTEDLCTDLHQVEPSSNRELFQRVKDGDASVCPEPGSVEPMTVTALQGDMVELACKRDSNLEQTIWLEDGKPLVYSLGAHIYGDTLLVSTGLVMDPRIYVCLHVEHANKKSFIKTSAVYRMQMTKQKCAEQVCTIVNRDIDLIVTVVFLGALSIILLLWNTYHTISYCQFAARQLAKDSIV